MSESRVAHHGNTPGSGPHQQGIAHRGRVEERAADMPHHGGRPDHRPPRRRFLGSLLTHRWREVDSNLRSLSGIPPGAQTDVGRQNGRFSTAGPAVRSRLSGESGANLNSAS